MEIRPECYLCLERLVELTAELATPDPQMQRRARHAARQLIAQDFSPAAIPALIASRFQLAIQKITGNADPFAPRKAAETAYLARMYDQIASAYGDDLESCLKLAVLGNAIDFFRPEAEITQDLLSQVNFGIFDWSLWQGELAKPGGLMLYLADNAGEQFFDRPLVAHLRRQGWRMVYVVKGGPIQNDVTREDLYASGLGPELEPVADTGARTLGLALEDSGPHFKALFDEAQIILAKGMGHFETLGHLGDPRIFFLLQAKCGPVARALGVPRRSFVFARSPVISLDTTRQVR